MCIQFAANVVDSATPDALACIPYKAQAITYHYNVTYNELGFSFEQAAALKEVVYAGKTYTLPERARILPNYATVTSIVPFGKIMGTSTVSVSCRGLSRQPLMMQLHSRAAHYQSVSLWMEGTT